MMLLKKRLKNANVAQVVHFCNLNINLIVFHKDTMFYKEKLNLQKLNERK